MSKSILLEFSEVSKKFGDKVALNQVSFTVAEGGITTLVGPNGAGKSTVAKLAAGLEKESSGRIIFKNGIKIGYVPQKSVFNPNLPIKASDFLSLLLGGLKIDDKFGLLKFAKFDSIKDKDLSFLSGGEF